MGTLGSDSYGYKQENETTTLLVYQRVFFWNMARGAILSLCICLRLMKYRVVQFSTMNVHEKSLMKIYHWYGTTLAVKHVVGLKLIGPMKLQVNKLRSLTLETKVRVLNSWLKVQGMSILLERENTCIPWWIWHWSGWDLCYITLMFMYKFVALCDRLFLVPCALLGIRMSYFALYLLRLYIRKFFFPHILNSLCWERQIIIQCWSLL